MIRLSQVSKIYHTPNTTLTALDHIDLQIPPGKVFGIIGRSGAGKSSLIRCLNLLERPTSGQICINGEELTQLSNKKLREARYHIGMIFQHFNLLSSRNVFENVALPLELMGKNVEEIKTRVISLLTLVGLQDKMNAYPHQLSGGQKQRVAIARALTGDPKVLLSDEATSALDPQMTQSILSLLKKINQTLGLTIVLITHEMEVVKSICDEVALIDHGRIIEQAPIEEFFTHPKTELAKELVSNCLKQHLPEALLQRLSPTPTDQNQKPLLRLVFHGKTAAEPLVADLIEKMQLKVNILQANIEYIRQHMIGLLVLQMLDNQHRLQEVMSYLASQKVHVEVIGYVV